MSVNLRIEGPDCTLFDGAVVPSGHAVQPPSQETPRQCAGVISTCTPGNTFTSTLDDVVSTWDGEWYDSMKDFKITSIEGIPIAGTNYWWLYINGSPATKGGCGLRINAGDFLLAAWGNFPLSASSVLYITVTPNPVKPDTDVVAKVFTRATDSSGKAIEIPIGGATVAGQMTDLKGEVTLKFPYPAVKRLKATRLGFIRSAAVTLTIAK